MDDKELLDIYTDYLISSLGLTTQTGLSRLLNGAISHDRIQRFLATSPKTGKDLWLVVKPYVRQIQQEEVILIIDDSISEKPVWHPSIMMVEDAFKELSFQPILSRDTLIHHMKYDLQTYL